MEIVYQDEWIVVAVKPSGVISTEVPGGMPELLRRQLQTDCILTVHRLDARVSGLMVLARSPEAAAELSRQIRDGEFQKEYLAVVHGTPPPSGLLSDLLGRDRSRRRTYVAQAPGKDVREAKLNYKSLDSCKGYTLVSIDLITGRTHQIRVQFSSRGWPLAGDRKYGIGDEDMPIALWSHRLSFRHPGDGRQMDLILPPPDRIPWTWFAACPCGRNDA